MGDPFLNYFALFLLIFVVVVLFYAIIAIHDIPYKIAESREHPHQDAIHWIWAMACRPERGRGFAHRSATQIGEPPSAATDLQDLRRRIEKIENKLKVGVE